MVSMISSAIYFPYINIRKTPWLGRVLLYWDRVFCLTPESFLEPRHRHRLQKHMLRLLEEGLLRPQPPAEYLGPAFVEQFLGSVEGREDLELRRETFRAGDYVPVHLWKLGGPLTEVERTLGEMKLADLRPTAGPGEGWLNVERSTAHELTASIALALGHLHPDAPKPITDEDDAFSVVVPSEGDQQSKKTALREIVLESLLPGPVDFVEVDRLIQFKEKYKDQLRVFRAKVESGVSLRRRLLSLGDGEADSKEAVTAEIEDWRQELEADVRQLEAQMKGHGWEPGRHELYAVALAGTGEAIKTAVQSGRGIGSLALPIGVAMTVALSGRLLGRDQTKRLLHEPMAYAALARREFAP
jgi:hypothetical protein